MKTLHLVLLAGIAYYLYSKRNTATAQVLPGMPGYHLMPQPDGSVKYMKDAEHKKDVTYALPPSSLIDPMENQSDYGHSYLPM